MRQISKSRRRLAAGAFLIVAGPVALGSVAYACQSLATLHSNPRAVTAGQTITLFGKGYSSSGTSTAIEIHLDTRNGPVIGSFAPTSVVNGPVTIPASTSAGRHILVATQYTAAGNAVSGTPGRATVSVSVGAARTSSEGSAATAAADATDPAAATAADVTPATPAAATSPAAANAASANAATPAKAAAAATAAAAVAQSTSDLATSGAAAIDAAGPAATATPALAGAAAAQPAPSTVDVGGLIPASSGSSSVLPGLTLAAGVALVLLSLGAFLKSGRKVFGSTPLAG
jgi:hypothetical protein